MSYQIEQTILLRDYLKELPISQAMIKRIKREGDFLVNGKSQTVRCLLQKGDCLEIIFPIENSNVQPENIPLKIIYEDDVCIAFLDLSQATYGHTLVIPKKHFENILEVDAQTLAHVMQVTQKLAKQIVEKLNAKGLNILTNTNEVAGQTVHHFHVHILPRYDEKELVIEFNDHSQDVDLDEVYQKIIK